MAYVDVENAIRHLRGVCVAKYPASFYHGIFVSADEISKLPTADVVEVVRCKDCKHWGGITYGQMCRKYSGAETKVCTEIDHYCSYGERSETE